MNPSLASKVPEMLSLKGDSLLRGDVFLRQISLGSDAYLEMAVGIKAEVPTIYRNHRPISSYPYG